MLMVERRRSEECRQWDGKFHMNDDDGAEAFTVCAFEDLSLKLSLHAGHYLLYCVNSSSGTFS